MWLNNIHHLSFIPKYKSLSAFAYGFWIIPVIALFGVYVTLGINDKNFKQLRET
jgi:hypothetical protein